MWVVAVVVLAVAGVFAYEATRATARPPVSAPTSSPTSSVATPAPGAPVGGYQIEAGAGGTDVAVDGRTPIGYASDCSGAVAAATNYYVAVMGGLYQDDHTSQSLTELLEQINGGLDGWDDTARTGPISGLVTEFETIRAQADELGQEFPGVEYHPEWGVFRVGDCADRASATVDVCGLVEATALAPGHSFPDGARVRVSWFEGDWRLVGLEHLAPEENPGAGVVPVDARAPLPASIRQAMVAAGGNGWGEYANAPED